MSRGDNVQGILGTIGPLWAKRGLGRVPRSASFFVVIHATFWQLRNGRFSPNLVSRCTAERYCLLHVVVQGPGSFRDRNNFSFYLYDVRLRSYGASKLPNFRILVYFPIFSIKHTFQWPPYSPGVTSQNDYDFSTWYSRRSKGVPLTGSGVFLQLLVGELGTQTCPKLRLWQMAISIQNSTIRRVRSGPKISENAQF